jgi:hypothetical protein
MTWWVILRGKEQPTTLQFPPPQWIRVFLPILEPPTNKILSFHLYERGGLPTVKLFIGKI